MAGTSTPAADAATLAPKKWWRPIDYKLPPHHTHPIVLTLIMAHKHLVRTVIQRTNSRCHHEMINAICNNRFSSERRACSCDYSSQICRQRNNDLSQINKQFSGLTLPNSNQSAYNILSMNSTCSLHIMKATFSTFTKSTYIHPLSQIVLEHLQSHHSDWVKRMGLETGLEVKSDGTFVLRFHSSAGEEGAEEGEQSIW